MVRGLKTASGLLRQGLAHGLFEFAVAGQAVEEEFAFGVEDVGVRDAAAADIGGWIGAFDDGVGELVLLCDFLHFIVGGILGMRSDDHQIVLVALGHPLHL